MKPHRIRMAHSLILNYGLYKKMQIYRPPLVSDREMTKFHSDDYVHFLQNVTPDNSEQYAIELGRYRIDVDCPVFDGLFMYCQMYTGGSVAGAYKLNRGSVDIAINWAGGLHHAKKSEASGFCYVNDIVLACLELLKYHSRVLYIDIDIHHGDGVEEAFYATDRVMTLSFHKYGEYFPGTGCTEDIGVGEGKKYALNFPLMDGVDDTSFERIFKEVVSKVMEHYRPGAIVLQCGADSLSGDRLGCFNLSLRGHGAAVQYVRSLNVPTLVLGGGGYTIRNVSRCWAYETGILLDETLRDELPYNDYYEYYGPDYNLHILPSNMENLNTPKYLEDKTYALVEMLRELPHAPSVAYATPIPKDADVQDAENAAKDAQDPDVRVTHADKDAAVDHPSAMYDGDADNRGEASGMVDATPGDVVMTT